MTSVRPIRAQASSKHPPEDWRVVRIPVIRFEWFVPPCGPVRHSFAPDAQILNDLLDVVAQFKVLRVLLREFVPYPHGVSPAGAHPLASVPDHPTQEVIH